MWSRFAGPVALALVAAVASHFGQELEARLQDPAGSVSHSVTAPQAMRADDLTPGVTLPDRPPAPRARAVGRRLVAFVGTFGPGDTVRAIAKWTPSGDALGPATSYLVGWMYRLASTPSDSQPRDLVPQRTKSGLADTVLVPLPPLGDSILVVVTVTPVRRGRFGDSMSAQRFFARYDARPPAVPSVRIDTTAVVVP